MLSGSDLEEMDDEELKSKVGNIYCFYRYKYEKEYRVMLVVSNIHLIRAGIIVLN